MTLAQTACRGRFGGHDRGSESRLSRPYRRQALCHGLGERRGGRFHPRTGTPLSVSRLEDDSMTRVRQDVVSAARFARMSVRLAASLALWAVALATPALAGPAEDAYIAGYVTAVLERQMDVKGSKITVKDGVVTVEPPACPPATARRSSRRSRRSPGVRQVVVVELQQPPGHSPASGGAAADDGRDAQRARRGGRGAAARRRVLPEGSPVLAPDRRSPGGRTSPPRTSDSTRMRGWATRPSPASARRSRWCAGPMGEKGGAGNRHPGRRLQPVRPRRAVERPRQLRLHRRLPVRVPDRRLLGAGALLPPELAPRRRVSDREPG